jgi:hypothetical protein
MCHNAAPAAQAAFFAPEFLATPLNNRHFGKNDERGQTIRRVIKGTDTGFNSWHDMCRVLRSLCAVFHSDGSAFHK